jgi:hypothetical protein
MSHRDDDIRPALGDQTQVAITRDVLARAIQDFRTSEALERQKIQGRYDLEAVLFAPKELKDERAAEDTGGDEAVAFIQPDHLEKAKVAPFLCRIEPKQRADLIGIYTRPAPANKAGGGLTIEQRDAIDNACRLLWNYRRVEAKKTIDALRALLATTQPSAEGVTDEQIDAIWDSVPWKDLNVNSLEHVAVLRRRFARALLAADPAEAKGEPT